MIRRQFTPPGNPVRDRILADFQISGHRGHPMLAIKYSAECIEPVSRAEWHWFDWRFVCPLRCCLLQAMHVCPHAKPPRRMLRFRLLMQKTKAARLANGLKSGEETPKEG